eukprot:m.200367 g.200367  ORF g.200367 m.200367 type:complete len:195 (+) comp15497_c3_seq1:1697-2281(+)
MSRLVQRDSSGNLLLNYGETLCTITPKALFTVHMDGTTLARQMRGLAFLTNQRVICMSDTPRPDGSFFFPVVMITNGRFEQPLFSANNFQADCAVLPDGSLTGQSLHVKIMFDCGGGHEFATAWAQLSAAIHVRRAPAAPPSYEQAAVQTPLDPAVAAAMQGAPMYHAASRPGAAFAAEGDKPPPYETFAKKSN